MPAFNAADACTFSVVVESEWSSSMSNNVDSPRRCTQDVWKPGGESTVHELMAEEIEGYMEGVEVRSRSEFLVERQRLLEAFPNLVIEVDDGIEDGEKGPPCAGT